MTPRIYGLACCNGASGTSSDHAAFSGGRKLQNAILRGVLRRDARLNILRVQDTAVNDADDPTVLAWAAEQDYLFLTHDLTTMPEYAYARVRAARPMPGVFAVSADVSIGVLIEDLLLIAEFSDAEEWADQVWYLPLR